MEQAMSDGYRISCATCGQANRVAQARLGENPKCGACGEELMALTEFDLAAHDKATRRDDVPLVVDYWAPWCGPCRMMAPDYAKAAKALKGQVRFAKVNTQDFPDISQRLGIRGIPLLILWKGGREVARLAGARPSAQIEAFARGQLRE
jgi:thioredoxin 2